MRLSLAGLPSLLGLDHFGDFNEMILIQYDARRLSVPLLFPHAHLDNRHRIIAEDVHHLYRELAPPRRAFVEHALQFQRPVLLGAEALPLVLEDVIPDPLFFPFAGFLILHPDDFPFALKVEVHRPVVNPVGPVLGEHFAGDDPILVLANLHDLPLLRHDPAALVLDLRLGIRNGVLRVEHG
jgi:hypothetical protein